MLVYFDNAATTYPKPECVYTAVNEGMRRYSFNAGRGTYIEAKKTFDMVCDTRGKIASLINEDGNKVVFSSSATEALNNILYGMDLKENDCVFVSPFEHNAVLRTLHNIGVTVIIMPFDKQTWDVKENELNDLYVVKKPKATVISHVSNVTGYRLPYEKIFSLAKLYNSLTVLDCAQSFGVYPVNKENIDFIVFAGHKSLYSVFGVAGYINLTEFDLSVYKVGGTGSDSLNLSMPESIPYRYEAGSLNTVAIYALNKSVEYLKTENFASKKSNLVKYLIERLSVIQGVNIYLPKDYCPYGIVSFNVEGFSADEIGNILSEDYNICVRTGYHCSPYIHDFIGSTKYNGTIRVSLGIFNTASEIDLLISAIKEILQ